MDECRTSNVRYLYGFGVNVYQGVGRWEMGSQEEMKWYPEHAWSSSFITGTTSVANEHNRKVMDSG